MKLLFPNGYKKALTLSYDDGIKQDERLIELLDKYKIKATFNVNSGILDDEDPWITKGVVVQRWEKDKAAKVYANHEVACHSLSHPNLAYEDDETIRHELTADRRNLEELTGRLVRGMAYPFGGHNLNVAEAMKKAGIIYGRTVMSSGKFDLPRDFYTWNPTCHHNDENIWEIINKFKQKDDAVKLFYIWGHAYEFDTDNNWDYIEKVLKSISLLEETWYATNIEIAEYINAYNDLVYSMDKKKAKNYASIKIWVEDGDGIKTIAPNETVVIKEG